MINNKQMNPRCGIFLILMAISLKTLVAVEVDYNRDVRPILSENCFSCHGFDEKGRKADLRLDKAESAYEVKAIVPKDIKNSEAWNRIISDDPDEVMPPPKSHLKMSEQDKQVIKQWIEQGAVYKGHWAFELPVKTALPETPHQKWVKNEIDSYIAKGWEEEKFAPSKEADKYTLIRRLSMTLRGLLPSVEEISQFVADESPLAYEKLVDQFLASPHFGERLALDWLDAARYSDTNGFSIDGGRHMWLWRDWVIKSFNENKPYNEFIKEQMAGDMLSNASDAQLIATGFQRNNMVTHEGGTIPAENLTNYNADRVKTLGECVLGLTLGCAQCHDHKFDPISQKDYFQMFAFFNTLDDVGSDGNGGVNPRPFFETKTVLVDQKEIVSLNQDIKKTEEQIALVDQVLLKKWVETEMAKIEDSKKGIKLAPTKLLKVITPNSGEGFEIKDNHINLNPTIRKVPFAIYDVLAELPKTLDRVDGIRIVFHPRKDDPLQGWGYSNFNPKKAKKGPVDVEGEEQETKELDLKPGKTNLTLNANPQKNDAKAKKCSQKNLWQTSMM
jgi:hypothetical protein